MKDHEDKRSTKQLEKNLKKLEMTKSRSDVTLMEKCIEKLNRVRDATIWY